MEPKKLKRNIFTTTIFFAVIMSNVLRLHALDNIRAVDAVQLFACGMLFGAIVVNVVWLMKSKPKE